MKIKNKIEMGIECKSWPMRCLFLWEDRGSLQPHSSGLKKKKWGSKYK